MFQGENPSMSCAHVVGSCPVTSGCPVQIPMQSILVVMCLGQTLHLPCLLVVVRWSSSACVDGSLTSVSLASVCLRAAVATI